MTKIKNLSKGEAAMLNSKLGLKILFSHDKIDLKNIIKEIEYKKSIKNLQLELLKLQYWVIKKKKKVVVLFEGREMAGKGSTIKKLTEYLNPRHIRVVALQIPTADEKKQWYFQRYIKHLPTPGSIAFFDRSWYNRAMVEPVNGFCTNKEYKIFMSQVNNFETMLLQSNTYLIKLYFSITKDIQAKRLDEIKSNPLEFWQLSKVDRNAQKLWDKYTEYKRAMIDGSDTKNAPWIIIDANHRPRARLDAISHILSAIPYK